VIPYLFVLRFHRYETIFQSFPILRHEVM